MPVRVRGYLKVPTTECCRHRRHLRAFHLESVSGCGNDRGLFYTLWSEPDDIDGLCVLKEMLAFPVLDFNVGDQHTLTNVDR